MSAWVGPWLWILRRMAAHRADVLLSRQAAYDTLVILWAEHDALAARLVDAGREAGLPPELADPEGWRAHLRLESRIMDLEASHFTPTALAVLLDPHATEATRRAVAVGEHDPWAHMVDRAPQAGVITCRACLGKGPPLPPVYATDREGIAHESDRCPQFKPAGIGWGPTGAPRIQGVRWLEDRDLSVRCVRCQPDPAPGRAFCRDDAGILHTAADCSAWVRWYA